MITSRPGIFAILISLVFLALLVFPFKLKERQLWPHDLPGQASIEWIPLSGAVPLHLALNPGQNQVDLSTGFGHLKWQSSLESDLREPFYRTQTWKLELRVKQPVGEALCPEIWITGLTFQASQTFIKSCKLVALETLVSEPGGWKHYEMQWELPKAIVPGLYRLEAKTQNGMAAEIQVAKSASGELWILPKSHGRMTFGQFLWDYVLERPKKGFFVVAVCLFALALSVLLASPQSFTSRQATWLYALGLVTLVVLATTLTPLLSGYDETHHVENSFKAVMEPSRSGISAGEYESARLSFYAHVKKELLDSHFLRLHNISPPPDGRCPHAIIGNCTLKPGPQELYGAMWSLLPQSLSMKLVQNIKWQRAYHVSIHALWLAIVVSLLSLVYGSRRALLATACVIGVFGVYGVFLPVVTNDFVFLLLALLFAGGLGSYFIASRRWVTLACAIVFSFLLLSLRNVDISWIAGLPPAVGLWLVGLMRLFTKPRILSRSFPDDTSHDSFHISAGLTGLSLCLLLTVGGIWFFVNSGNLIDLRGLPLLGELLQERWASLAVANFWEINSSNFGEILGAYASTAFGAYNWGNTLLPHSLYFILFGLFVFICLSAFASQISSGTFQSSTILVVCISVLLGAQIFIIIAVSSIYFGQASEHWRTFAQVRMSASGFAVFALPFFLAPERSLRLVLAASLPLQILMMVFAYRVALY